MAEAKTKTVAGETVVVEDKRTLVERLVDVKNDIGAVGKGDRNSSQGFNFRGIDAVLNAVSAPLRKHGILVYPRLTSLEKGTASTSGGKTMNTVVVIVDYVFTDGVDQVVTTAPGEAFDSGDKAVAKAMSVAYRTALIQALSLPTDEPDPDHDFYAAAAGVDQLTDDQVIAEAKKAEDVTALQDLWRDQRVTGRSHAVQDAITSRVGYLRGETSA